MRHVFYSKIVDIRELIKTTRGWRDEHGNGYTEMQSLGWFVRLDGSWESLHVGAEKPEGLQVGQRVKVSIEAVE